MDLDELQSVQSRERQTDSLQQLRATFYQDAAEYIQRLERERDDAAERADDPWSSPEVSRLNDDIDTAEGTVEAIYERRVGKIVKMASLAAADMPTDDGGLTEEERSLFETLVAAIENNREEVFAILDGESPPGRGATDPVRDPPADGDAGSPAGDGPGTDPTKSGPAADAPDSTGTGRSTPGTAGTTDEGRESHPEPADLRPAGDSASGDDTRGDTAAGGQPGPASDAASAGEGSVGAADLMGGDDPDGGSATAPGDGPPGQGQPGEVSRGESDGTPGPDENREPAEPTRSDGSGLADHAHGGPPATGEAPDVERATVRITSDVGEIFGVDERAYDLTAEDVVTLPEPNAGPLVEDGAAERLD